MIEPSFKSEEERRKFCEEIGKALARVRDLKMERERREAAENDAAACAESCNQKYAKVKELEASLKAAREALVQKHNAIIGALASLNDATMDGSNHKRARELLSKAKALPPLSNNTPEGKP